ncbi:MAG: FAD-binding oxidoreductase [Proteobacteria bacterium]|nr:FAD-binding oxidoreductase [Pseudomonadota bacterium]
MPPELDLKLIATKNINANTVHMEFAIQNNQSLELIAGQFVRLIFQQNGEKVYRSYSVANILQHNSDTIHTIELAVSWVTGGVATIALANMKIGNIIAASAPYGRFCLTEKKWQRYFLVATGTGVTPYRAMTNELKQRIQADNAEVFIVMGARDASGLLYADEFRANAKESGYNYISCLSRDSLTQPTKLDFQGHVQIYLKQVDFDPENDVVYLCGNPAMVDDAFALLKEKNLPVAQIRREKYVSPPIRKKPTAFNIVNR